MRAGVAQHSIESDVRLPSETGYTTVTETGYTTVTVLGLCILFLVLGFALGVTWTIYLRQRAVTSTASQEVVIGQLPQTPRPPGPQTPASLRALRE